MDHAVRDRLSPGARLGLVMALVNFATKLPILPFGLPVEFNADEIYVLKDPLKLTYLYSQGNFAHPTNLFFWIVQAWYALLFPVGWLLGEWGGLSQFRAAIVSEASLVLFWGRLLGAAASACAVYVLSLAVAHVVQGKWERLLIVAMLALNPLDLVSSAWLKFDGAGLLLNAVLLASFLRYLDSHTDRDRRWLYGLAIAACSFRVDFVALPIAVLVYDAVSRRPFRPVAGAWAAGAAAYGAITLLPLVQAYRYWGRGGVETGLTVATTFESHIFERLVSDLASGALPRIVGSSLGFYGWLLAGLGVPLAIACASGIVRDRRVRWLLVLAAIEIMPLLVSSAQATRYFLPASVCLLLAASFAISLATSPALRVGLLSAMLAFCASLTIETTIHVATLSDSRLEAGRYIVARSTADDVIAVENYMNPGYHAEIAECPDELRKKATATQQAGSGSGETFALWAARPATDCRRVLEIAEADRFEASSFRGRWINTYDSASLDRVSPAPKFFSTDSLYGGAPVNERERWRRPTPTVFAEWILKNYDLVARFEPAYVEPRVRRLLGSTPYDARVYVYQRRPSPSAP